MNRAATLLRWWNFAGIFLGFAALGQDSLGPTLLIEAAGRVEFSTGGSTNWRPAAAGVVLKPGDRVRTRELSRAAVQLSDRSIIRLDQRTTLELLPPRRAEKKRFGLPAGALYFFNREKPSEVEFDTPLAAGAIRGTEFLLRVAEPDWALDLALMDGRVALQTAGGEISLQGGEQLALAPGGPPRKTALLNATARIQWALYYPAVVVPEDLGFDAEAQSALAGVLDAYRAGDLLAALQAWPAGLTQGGPGLAALHAQLELAVGRVSEAEELLGPRPTNSAASALKEIIALVRGQSAEAAPVGQTASGLLARSYALQSSAELERARQAAARAVELAPQSGFAHARLAELEFALGHRRGALAELEQALRLAPRLASARALQGFVLLEQGATGSALACFDEARQLDAALGPAWVGRGLCQMRQRRFAEARASFQAAAALEPQRGLFRAYLGKAESELGDAAADKELRLAKQLDPADPTAWLYSALRLWQENRINEAIRALETSSELNDNRAVFRSRLLLDNDRAVRSANLAALYDDAAMAEASRRAAMRSVGEDYANFSGHLFLAGSYQAQEAADRYDLRLETARQSELLVGNLLAPPGAGNLSQVLSQQERLRFFAEQPVGLSSVTRYGSGGDWSQTGTVFGSFDGFTYAADSVYESFHGQRANNASERRDFILTLKQRVGPEDEAYLQIGDFRTETGDVSLLDDPAQANRGLRVQERQAPDLYVGWHHAWSPGAHTLFLAGRLDDRLAYTDPQAEPIFLVQSGGATTQVQHPPLGPLFTNAFVSQFTLYTVELQQVFETECQAIVAGGRWQTGRPEVQATLSRVLSGNITDQAESGDFNRADGYAYYTLRPCRCLSLVGGISYSRIEFPENTDLPPVSFRAVSRDQVSPKAGLLFAPWTRGLLRAGYTRSLGGLFFDNSVRLEPTQVGGFNQAFRSLIPESVAGLVPGARFETAGVGFDQSFASGTWLGVEGEWLDSDASRAVGVLTNSLFLPVPDARGLTRQTLSFRERNVSAYASQLLGDGFSVSARYRLSEATLTGRFPDVPPAAAGLGQIEQHDKAVLQQVLLAAAFSHPSGLFARWETAWYRQSNSGYQPALAGDPFWQHNAWLGYRFPRRQAEITVGVLNLTDTDYRLNPLNLHADLARHRTFVTSLRVNF